MILRRLVAFAILAAITAPLVIPLVTAAANPRAWQAWLEGGRLAILFANSIALAALSCLLAIPLGTAIAFGLFANAAPGRRISLALFAVALATPLPILTIAGSLFGTNLLGPWNQFGQGIIPAACIHAWAALPWVVWIVGPAFGIERSLNDDIRTNAPPLIHAKFVLRRAGRAIALAAAWVIVQTAGEIVVSDMAQVRTFAEEVYTQFVSPGVSEGSSAELALARAVIVSAPIPLLFTVILFRVVCKEWLEERSEQHYAERPFGQSGWLNGGIVATIALCILGFPMMGLAIRASAGHGAIAVMTNSFQAGWQNAALLMGSALGAIIVGLAVTSFALAVCLAARKQPMYRAPLAAIALLAATSAGPVLGVGLLAVIGSLIELESRIGGSLFANAFYYHSSPLPVWWAHAVRGFPLALAVLWPIVRMLPRSFHEATRLETGSRLAQFRHDVLPHCGRAAVASTLLVAAMALGEVSASKIVATAGGQTFAHDLFGRMHFGVTPELAGMSLALLAIVGVLGIVFAWISAYSANSTAKPSRALRATASVNSM